MQVKVEFSVSVNDLGLVADALHRIESGTYYTSLSVGIESDNVVETIKSGGQIPGTKEIISTAVAEAVANRKAEEAANPPSDEDAGVEEAHAKVAASAPPGGGGLKGKQEMKARIDAAKKDKQELLAIICELRGAPATEEESKKRSSTLYPLALELLEANGAPAPTSAAIEPEVVDAEVVEDASKETALEAQERAAMYAEIVLLCDDPSVTKSDVAEELDKEPLGTVREQLEGYRAMAVAADGTPASDTGGGSVYDDFPEVKDMNLPYKVIDHVATKLAESGITEQAALSGAIMEVLGELCEAGHLAFPDASALAKFSKLADMIAKKRGN